MPLSPTDPLDAAHSAKPDGAFWKSKRAVWVVLATAGMALALALIERGMGRSWLGPDHRLGLWEGSIWSSECSQRLVDPYSFSHVGHGIVLFGLLWLVGRRWPVSLRFLVAALLEASWEVLENSPIIIQRYREATIALGYDGDSIVNSLSDLLMMSLGFALAWRLRPWVTIALFVAMEVGCLGWIRDNLTLNVIMLLCPLESIKAWQIAGRPG